jgi:hypothetical protein
LTFSIFYFFV